MRKYSARGTLLQIPLLRERYGSSVLASVFLHVAFAALLIAVPYLFPQPAPISIGTGPGGGSGDSSYTVGIADELAGGIGMTKPSLIPQAPPLPAEQPSPPKQEPAEAVALPHTVEPKKKAPKVDTAAAKKATPAAANNVIPTEPEPGAGGTGGIAGGSGGGRGGGHGVLIGLGSGGLGDLYYIRLVESRIGSNWIRPIDNQRIEMVYSFVITNEGHIRDIRQVKSSGNQLLDLTAERAIRASTPLPPLPPELRGRPVEFLSQFIHPPNSR